MIRIIAICVYWNSSKYIVTHCNNVHICRNSNPDYPTQPPRRQIKPIIDATWHRFDNICTVQKRMRFRPSGSRPYMRDISDCILQSSSRDHSRPCKSPSFLQICNLHYTLILLLFTIYVNSFHSCYMLIF